MKRKQKKTNPADKILSAERAEIDAIRQNSEYRDGNKAAPDNNIFWEEFSDPLSSKGN